MFDIGWTEMLVIAIVMIVVVGPKDLPRMLRTFGKTTTKLRAMAGDFQRQFNEALKEAELDEVKKSVDELRSLNPTAEIKKQLNPFKEAAADIRTGIEATSKPKAPAEPLKNGATAMPDAAVPEIAPDTPPLPAAAEPSPAVTAAPAPKAKAAAAGAKAKSRTSSAKPKTAARAKPAAAAKPAGKAETAARASTKTAAAKPKKAAAQKSAGTPK